MANTFKSYLAKDVGVTALPLITVAAATIETLIGLSIANTSVSSISVDVYITRSATNIYIIKGASIPVGQTFILSGGDQKLVLQSSDILNVVSSAAASADAIASVLELT